MRQEGAVQRPAGPPADAIAAGHPCFDAAAHAVIGRIHLPVAPRCNIHCAFCDRRVCANLGLQRPGWSARILSPEEAAAWVRRLASEWQQPGAEARSFVVGVAGPGEPLANPETFEALRLVQREFPLLTKRISTNGLLLEASLPALLEVGVRALTVTINAPDAEVGARLTEWVRVAPAGRPGRALRGRSGAAALLEAQQRGVRASLEAGLALKVNTVLVPGVNDGEALERLARVLGEAGVPLMNIVPLIPAGHLAGHRAPSCDELRSARDRCARFVPQFRLCEQCRADVVRPPRGSAAAEEGRSASPAGA